MIYSHWPDGSDPILFNPTFPELMEIGKQPWDSIRICVEGDDIALATGFGNTHSSICEGVQKLLGRRWLCSDDPILFREGGAYWFNLEHLGGGRKVPLAKGLRQVFSEDHANIIRDLVQMRGEF